MEQNSETMYAYLRNNTYFFTPSLDLAIQRSDAGEALVLNNQPNEPLNI